MAIATLERTRPAARAVVALPAAATLLALMNYCAPMTTLGATAAGLHAGEGARVWLLSGISLGLSAALLAVGSLADDHGRRRVFVAGAAVLAVASVVCAAAPNAPVFVAGRIVQGAASAALLATGLGIIGHTFPAGPERAKATGIWGAMLGAGIALGPIGSSALAQAGEWRLWYWLTALAAVLLGLAAARSLPESRAERRRGLDLPGALTMSAGVAALTAAVTLGRTGWARPSVAGLFVAAAVLLALFCLIESRRHRPMLDLGLFRRPGFVVSTVGALFTGLAVIGLMSYLAFEFEPALGLTPLGSSLLLGVWSGMSFVVALGARRLGPRISVPRQLALGLLLSAAGELALLGLSWWWLVPGLLVAGAGSGLANAMLARLAVESVPADRASMGSGANNTARYIGASVGVAMVITISGHGVDAAIVVSAALAVIGAVLTISIRRSPR